MQTSLRRFRSSTPSPKSYEFALHGLLALSSTSASHPGVDFAPASTLSPDQEVSTFDFARREDAFSVQDAKSSQRRPESNQRESSHRSRLSCGSVRRDLPDLSPEFGKFDATGGPFHAPAAPSVDEMRPSEASPADLGAADSAIELLKTYRYSVAPWLDICDADQHFGVELLTIARREPKVRTWIMRVAAAASGMAQLLEDPNAYKIPSLEVASDATHLNFNVEATLSVLDLVIDATPDLAASWDRRKDQNRRSQVMETLLLESKHSSMHASAYWLSVRLGIIDRWKFLVWRVDSCRAKLRPDGWCTSNSPSSP
jgi:hypothetical protein